MCSLTTVEGPVLSVLLVTVQVALVTRSTVMHALGLVLPFLSYWLKHMSITFSSKRLSRQTHKAEDYLNKWFSLCCELACVLPPLSLSSVSVDFCHVVDLEALHHLLEPTEVSPVTA